MSGDDALWKNTVISCMALATVLEGEGQYNNAKLVRAAVDSLTRTGAYQIQMPSKKEALAEEILQIAQALSTLQVDQALLDALQRGARALSAGKLPLINETPNAFVCRNCGYVTLRTPVDLCPVCGAWAGTFQLFIPVYWLNALEPPTALERLQQTPLEVGALISGLSEMEMSRLPDDRGWAIRDTLTHLRDAQGVIDFRIDLFLKEKNPILESKAVFAWATQKEGQSPQAAEIFENYRASREGMLEKLRNIPFTDWYRTGQHEEFGEVSLRQQVSYFAAHELTHLPQIDRLRKQITGG